MRLVAAVLTIVVLGGCGSAPSVPTENWLVRRDATATTAADDDAVLVSLAGVEVASHLGGVVIDRANGEVDTLVYHRWAAPIGEMVRGWVRSRLAESQRVRGVVGSGDRADVHLRLEVRRFEFAESTDGSPARAKVELWGLVGNVPFGPLAGSEPLAAIDGPALPIAMSAALRRAVDRLVPIVEAAASSSSGH